MAKKPTSSVNVTFVSPVTSISDKSQVKAAYKDLCKQITSLAEAIAADPNVIISHSSVVGITEPVTQVEPVDVKMAELQTISKRISKGKSPAVTPGFKSKFDAPDVVDVEEVKTTKASDSDFDEKPRVKACEWVKTATLPPVPKSERPPIVDVEVETETEEKPKHWVPPVSKAAPTKSEVPESAAGVDTKLEAFFAKNGLRKTENSLKMISFFLSHADMEVSTEDIATKAGLDKSVVASWLAQTGKNVKAVKGGEKRGHYVFVSSKSKI